MASRMAAPGSDTVAFAKARLSSSSPTVLHLIFTSSVCIRKSRRVQSVPTTGDSRIREANKPHNPPVTPLNSLP